MAVDKTWCNYKKPGLRDHRTKRSWKSEEIGFLSLTRSLSGCFKFEQETNFDIVILPLHNSICPYLLLSVVQSVTKNGPLL